MVAAKPIKNRVRRVIISVFYLFRICGSMFSSVVIVIAMTLHHILFKAAVFFIAHVADIIGKSGIKAAAAISPAPAKKEADNCADKEEE
jgi:hypothetical protein